MLAGKSFIVDPNIFLVNPANRAFVEGNAASPAKPILWYVGLMDLPITVIFLGLGANVLPIPLPESLESIRWVFLLIGLISLSSSVFIILYVRRLSFSGKLIEGRVVRSEVRAGIRGTKPEHQAIQVEYTDPEGKHQQILYTRSTGLGKPLPNLGAQAAVLYAGNGRVRLL